MKVFNTENYHAATFAALNKVANRKGAKVNWTAFAKQHNISKNFGTVLHRVGLLQKSNGMYVSNAPQHVTKSSAREIVNILRNNDLMAQPNNSKAINQAKSQLSQRGYINPNHTRGRVRGRKVSATSEILKRSAISKVTRNAHKLTNVPTDILLAEVRRRIG